MHTHVSTNVSNATKAKENRSTHLIEGERRENRSRTVVVHSRVELYYLHLHSPDHPSYGPALRHGPVLDSPEKARSTPGPADAFGPRASARRGSPASSGGRRCARRPRRGRRFPRRPASRARGCRRSARRSGCRCCRAWSTAARARRPARSRTPAPLPPSSRTSCTRTPAAIGTERAAHARVSLRVRDAAAPCRARSTAKPYHNSRST